MNFMNNEYPFINFEAFYKFDVARQGGSGNEIPYTSLTQFTHIHVGQLFGYGSAFWIWVCCE